MARRRDARCRRTNDAEQQALVPLDCANFDPLPFFSYDCEAVTLAPSSICTNRGYRTTDDGIGSLCPEKEPLSPRTSQRLVAGASFLVNTTSGGLSSLKKKALSKSSSPKPDNMCSPPTTPNTTSYANPTPTIPSLSLAPPPRPSSRPMSSPRQTKREGQRPSGPDELPLPVDEVSTRVTTYKGNEVCQYQGAFWKITRVDNDKYLLAPVFQVGYFCALSLANELVVDNFEKGFWNFRFVRSLGSYIIRPDDRQELLISITDKGDAKGEKPKGGVFSNRNSLFICPASSIAKRILFDHIVDMCSDVTENIPIRFNLDWMKKISDTTYLTQIWIPGTHDTGSYPGHSVKMVDTLARTQSFTITNQLKAGIRFFDIRLRHCKDQLLVYHGNVFCNEDWGGVLYKIRDFLTENPTECVITKIQQEYTPSGNIFSTWGSLVQEGLEQIPEDFRWTEKRIPMLGEARGKVVVTTWSPMLNSEYLDLGFIPWGGVCKEDERYYIQDEFFGPSIDKKWKLMIKLWMRAYKHQLEYPDHPPYFFANHASATRVVTYQLNALGPKKYAKQVHRRLLAAVLMGPHAPQIFLMDFPSVNLIEAIIERNYTAPPKTNEANFPTFTTQVVVSR